MSKVYGPDYGDLKMRTLKPINRHLLITPHSKKNETPNGVVLPDDYSPEQDLFVEATVLDLADDCNQQLMIIKNTASDIEKKIVVDQSMIQEINLKDETYHLILENYVIGVFDAGNTHEG